MESLYFKMSGKAFDEGYRLDKTIDGLIGLQQVLDGTYKGVSGKSRITKKDREQFQVVAYDIQHGSLLVMLGAVFSSLQQTMPFIPSMSPDVMWGYTKETAKFLHNLYKSAHSGKALHVEQKDNGMSVVTTGNDNETTIYQGPVYQIGVQMIGGLRKLDDVLEEEKVENIEIGSKYDKEPAIIIPLNEKGLYYAPVTVDKEPRKLKCDIFDFNKYDRVGKLKVKESQDVPSGNYNFKVVGSQDVEEFILSMTETEIEINCLVEYEHDPLKETKIGMLLIVDIAA